MPSAWLAAAVLWTLSLAWYARSNPQMAAIHIAGHLMIDVMR